MKTFIRCERIMPPCSLNTAASSSHEQVSQIPIEPTDSSTDSNDILSSQFSESFGEDSEEHLCMENTPKKFLLVDWQTLKSLYERCPTCREVSKMSQVTKMGTLISVEIKCQYHSTNWSL